MLSYLIFTSTIIFPFLCSECHVFKVSSSVVVNMCLYADFLVNLIYYNGYNGCDFLCLSVWLCNTFELLMLLLTEVPVGVQP